MSAYADDDGRDGRGQAAALKALAQSANAAVGTDAKGRVTVWNPAAERLFGRLASQALGRRCYDLLEGRDVFGNRLCHENCAIRQMAQRQEAINGFEVVVPHTPKREQTLHVTAMAVPGDEDGPTLMHFFQPVDAEGRLARALEKVAGSGDGKREGRSAGPSRGRRLQLVDPDAEDVLHRGDDEDLDEDDEPQALSRAATAPIAAGAQPPLTGREREVLQAVAGGLSNKEVAGQLAISLATVRNHVHNILEKLSVHSKLEAVSLAFRRGWIRGMDESAA